MGYREDWFRNNPSNHGWYTCSKCGKKIRKADVDVDHIIPQKYGGSDKLFNLQCMCKHCNRSKQADTDETLSDLVKTNRQRAIKHVKKKINNAGEKILSGVSKVLPHKTKSSTNKSSASKSSTNKSSASKSSASKSSASKSSASKSSASKSSASKSSANKSSTK